MIRKLVASLGAAALLTTALVSATPTVGSAAAGPVIVDVTADTPGTCPSTSGTTTCSLRSAVEFANRQRNTRVDIVLGAGTYRLETPLTISGGHRILGARQPIGSPGATVIDAMQHQALIVDAEGVTVQGVGIVNASNSAGPGAIAVKRNRKNFLLLESSVYQSSGLEGGGLFVDTNASATVQRSTFAGNTAKNKGGAIRVLGKLDIVNSTFTGNTAQSGGAVSVAGSTTASFSTFIDNTSNSEKGAGVDRNGGTVYVTGSILARANQQSAAGSDCSGNPDLIGANYVGSAQGCNPDASVLVGTVVGPANVAPLAKNGGPTETMALNVPSPAIDAHPTCKPVDATRSFGADAVQTDQRNTGRPQGAACDLGAFEYQALSVALTLSSDTITPVVGAERLPSSAIGRSVIATDQLFGDSLAASPLSAFPLESAPLSAFPLSAFPLNAFPLSAFPLSAFFTAATPLSAFPLSAFPLSAFPLSAFPLSDLALIDGTTWEDVLKNSDFESVPLQSLTLDDVAKVPKVQQLNLGQMNLEGTPLSAFPLSAFLLSSVPLSAFPLSAFGAGVTNWCQVDVLDDFCAVDPKKADDDVNPIDKSFTLASLALAGVPLSAFPLSAFPLSAFPLNAFPLNAFPLNAFPLSAFNWAATPLSAFPLSAFPLSAFSAESPNRIVDCSLVDCATATLGDAAAKQALLADFGALGALFVAHPEALLALGDITLADLIAGLVPPSSVAWEQVDLEVPGLQNAGDPTEWTFHYLADITLSAPASTVSLAISLPRGFAYAPDGTTLDGTAVGDPALSCADTSSTDCIGDRTIATFQLGSLGVGTHKLSIPARAGFVLQSGNADATVRASTGSAAVAASASHTVSVQAPPRATSPTPIRAAGAPCAGATFDGDVQLGWTPPVDPASGRAESYNDVHLYTFEISQEDAACGTRADLYLSNLPIDFDLTLYGAMSTPLRGTPRESIPYLDDVTFDLNPFDDVIQADTVQDIPQRLPGTFPGADNYAVVAVSSNRDIGDEHIRTGTLRAGTYVIQVSNYNGATSNLPYALRLRSESGTVRRPVCAALPAPTALPGVLPAGLPIGVNTLILVNQQMLDREYGADRRATVMASLTSLAGRSDLGVIGAVVPVDGDVEVRAAYARRLADPCNAQLSNDVVREIGRVIDRYDAETIENIVIVGDDRQIPMANIVDDANFANERTFAQEFPFTQGPRGNNESIGALDAGMYRSDDPYGTTAGIRVRDHELFVPERAVGRLVETPEEITGYIANYVNYGGRLDPDTAKNAFESGYEFLEDGAQANADALTRRGYTTDTLLGKTWTDAQLAARLGTRHDVVGINAHFDENHALPAYDNFNPRASDKNLFDSSELPLAVDRSVVYSMGCHSGYSLSDVQVGSAAPDWAQVITGQRVNTFQRTNTFAGNTGFGYGDTDRVALTEELTAILADEIGQGGSVGRAWVDAKQRMLSELLVLDAYQEKVVQQFVFYGLPMFHLHDRPTNLAVAAEGSPSFTVPSIVAPSLVQDVHTQQQIQPVEVIGVLPTGGPVAADVSQFHLNVAPSGAGSYYDLDGQTLDVNGHPIQPLYTHDLPAVPGLLARDALITELTSQNVDRAFDPVFFWASPNYGGPRPEHFDGSFPAEMSTVRTYRSNGKQRQQVLLAAGQYRASDEEPDVGTQRLHTSIGAQVYYAAVGDLDFTPPLVNRSTGLVNAGSVRFDVSVDDTAERVYVLYRNAQERKWHGLDLSRNDLVWSGVGQFTSTSSSDSVEFIVQAVDDHGNVAMSNGKSQYFLAASPSGVSALALTATGPKLIESSGWFTGGVTVTADNDGASSTIDPGIRFRLGTAPFTAYSGPVTVPAGATGTTVANAIDTSGAFAALNVQIDAEVPRVEISLRPSEWTKGPVEVALNVSDGIGSGVARILYTLDGSEPGVGSPGTFVYSDTARPSVTAEGVAVRAIAIDVAGNTGRAGPVEVPIDATRPTAAVDVVDADGTDDDMVAHGSKLTATYSCGDGGSGVASCVVTVDGTVVTGASPISLPTDVLGNHVVKVVATDGVELVTTSTDEYRVVDRTPPNATVSVTPTRVAMGQSVVVTYACTDTLSPISSCVVKLDGVAVTTNGTSGSVTVPAGSRGVHALTATAIDGATNPSAPASASFTTYDPSPPTVTLSVSPTVARVGSTVMATYSCADADSGIQTCAITVTDQTGKVVHSESSSGVETSISLPTTATGSYIVVVVGTNIDGVSSAASGTTVTYRVGLCVIEKYDPTQAKRVGTNYTIKIEICDGNRIISSRRLVLTATAIVGPDGARYTPGANDSGAANGNGYVFRYAGKDGYIYNLDTTGFTGMPAPAGTLYQLEFEARDGNTLVGIGQAGFTLVP